VTVHSDPGVLGWTVFSYRFPPMLQHIFRGHDEMTVARRLVPCVDLHTDSLWGKGQHDSRLGAGGLVNEKSNLR
jgi:hypothetical protein